MKTAALILCVLFAGCRCVVEIGPTADPTAAIIDDGTADDNQKIKNAIAEMQRTLSATPNDLDALNAALRLYGITRPRKDK